MSLSIFKIKEDEAHVKGKSRGWIQWKGTEVCIDLFCEACGWNGHYDGDFLYFVECPKCHTAYSVGQNILLHKLTEEEKVHAKGHCYKIPEL